MTHQCPYCSDWREDFQSLQRHCMDRHDAIISKDSERYADIDYKSRAEALSELVEKLKPYLKHDPRCNWEYYRGDSTNQCVCGLDALLKNSKE